MIGYVLTGHGFTIMVTDHLGLFLHAMMRQAILEVNSAHTAASSLARNTSHSLERSGSVGILRKRLNMVKQKFVPK